MNQAQKRLMEEINNRVTIMQRTAKNHGDEIFGRLKELELSLNPSLPTKDTIVSIVNLIHSILLDQYGIIDEFIRFMLCTTAKYLEKLPQSRLNGILEYIQKEKALPITLIQDSQSGR